MCFLDLILAYRCMFSVVHPGRSNVAKWLVLALVTGPGVLPLDRFYLDIDK
jgi:hypothetical protein